MDRGGAQVAITAVVKELGFKPTFRTRAQDFPEFV